MRLPRLIIVFASFASLMTIHVALAQANDYRIVARRVVATPSDPTPLGITGDFGNVAIAPDGRIAFNATNRIQLPDGSRVTRRAAFVERDGQLQVVTAGLVSNDQASPTVFAVDAAGNVVVRGVLGVLPGADTFAIDRPNDAPLALASVGQPLPGVPGFSITSIVPLTGNPIEVPRRLPADLQYPVPVVASPTAGGSSVTCMLAGSANGPRVIASSTLLPGSSALPQMFVSWPFNVTSGGSFLTSNVASETQFPFVYVPPISSQLAWDVSTVNPQSGNMRVADDGTIVASVSSSTGVAIVMGRPGAMSVVLREGSVINSSRGTARVGFNPSGSFAFLSIDADGTAYVLVNRVTLTNPTQTGFIFGVVRLRVNEPPRFAYISTEPVRRRNGSLLATRTDVNVRSPLPNQGTGRLTWFVPYGSSQTALCSLTDDGDPIVLFESSTTIGSPSVFVPAAIVPSTLPAGSLSGFSTNVNNDAVIAINGAAPAVVVCPAMRFTCGDIDFNNNAIFPENQDIIDYFDVLAGAPCPTLRCDTIDFNRNGVFPEDQDVLDFLHVFAGGSCNP
jgi:hypothetical protein